MKRTQPVTKDELVHAIERLTNLIIRLWAEKEDWKDTLVIVNPQKKSPDS